MPTIPKTLHEHINTAFPDHVCLIGTVLPNGFAQITPRGSTMVFDDDHLALWERGKGSTTENMTDGSKVTVYFRKPQLRTDGTAAQGRHRPLLRYCPPVQIRPGLRRGLAPPDPAGKG